MKLFEPGSGAVIDAAIGPRGLEARKPPKVYLITPEQAVALGLLVLQATAEELAALRAAGFRLHGQNRSYPPKFDRLGRDGSCRIPSFVLVEDPDRSSHPL